MEINLYCEIMDHLLCGETTTDIALWARANRDPKITVARIQNIKNEMADEVAYEERAMSANLHVYGSC